MSSWRNRTTAAPLALVASAIAASGQDKVTYDDHVLPIFQQACLNCHNPDKARGGLDLSTYPGTLKGGSGGKIVEPGNTASSLIAVVRHTAEPVMPPEGDKLSNDHIQILTRWIEGGLLENAKSTARKAEKPKFAMSPHADPAAKPEGPPPMPRHLLLEPAVLTERAASIRALAASPWAPLLAVTSQNQVLLHHTESLELVGILPFPEGDPVSLTFTPDARYLIVGGGVPGKSGTTVTFDVTTGERLLTVGREFDSILAADTRPGFDLVATGGPSRLLKIWDTSSGEAVKSIKKHSDWITALDISADGVLLASGDRNGGVWVWEAESGNEFHTLRAHQAGITSAVFRADSNILATASADGTLRFWEMNGGTEVKKSDAHPGGVTAFSFARDGSSVSAGRDHSAKLWKPDFNHALDIAKNLPSLPTAVALDAEAKRAFIGGADGVVRVYQTDGAKPVGEIPGNPPSIESRLAGIDSAIRKQQENITSISGKQAALAAARDKARADLEEAGKSHKQAVSIHQAASTTTNDQPEEVRRKLAEDALARIAPAEAAAKAAHEAFAAAEKSLSDSAAAADSAAKHLAALETSRKHWSAAAINTRAITARAAAANAYSEFDETHHPFTSALTESLARAETLNRKRAERDSFAKSFHSRLGGGNPSPSAELVAEFEATLTAIDVVIRREVDSLRAAERALVEARSRIPPAAVHAHELKSQAESLDRAYHEALK